MDLVVRRIWEMCCGISLLLVGAVVFAAVGLMPMVGLWVSLGVAGAVMVSVAVGLLVRMPGKEV